MSQSCITALAVASPLVEVFFRLMRKYATTDTAEAKGFKPYRGFWEETDFNHDRIRSATAALIRCNFHILRLVNYLGGPHTNEHRDLSAIKWRLSRSVDAELLEEVLDLYRRGSPTVVKGHSTDDNFKAY